jgi:holin-like protein
VAIAKGILQIGILYLFSILGNFLQDTFHLPLPGNIIGLLLLLSALLMNLFKVEWINQGSGYLLAILPLLLVPATVGIMNYPSLFTGSGLLIFLIVVLSTVLTILVTAKTSQTLEERISKRKEPEKSA